MAAAVQETDHPRQRVEEPVAGRVFHWAFSVVVLVAFAMAIWTHGLAGGSGGNVLTWTIAALLADLMFVRFRCASLSMSLPVLLAAGFVHSPTVTGLIAFLGCLDPMELRRETSIDRALFNRSQVALSAAAASATAHSLGDVELSWPIVLVVSAAALLADCVVNVLLVAASTVASGRASWGTAVLGLWGAEPRATAALYALVSLLAPLLAFVFVVWGPIALLISTALLWPCRLALSQIEKLHVANHGVRIRDAALQKAAESADFEREDERLILAGDLHDELLPALFKVHLMGQVIRQDLESGRLLELDEDVPELLQATQAAQDAVRQVVLGLRISSGGFRGVASAIRSHADQLEGVGKPRFFLSLEEVSGCERSERVLFQVAKEAMTNACRYSNARRVMVRLAVLLDQAVASLTLDDDGDGFEVSGVDLKQHFGIQLMRERVEGVGGFFNLESAPGRGTHISAQVPLWGQSSQPGTNAPRGEPGGV